MPQQVEIIQPDADDSAAASHERLRPSSGKWPAFVGLVVLLLGVWLLRSGGSPALDPELAVATTARQTGPEDESSAEPAFPGVAPDGIAANGQAGSRPDSLVSWQGGTSTIVIIESAESIYELDLDTHERTFLSPPEALVDADPMTIGPNLVVIGESGAWISTELGWDYLGVADRVLPSSKPHRIWLRRDFAKQAATDAQYLWSETDFSGEVTRTMFRDRPVYFPTPELVSGLGNGVFRFTDNPVNPWRVLSDRGTPVAAGLNDLITWECTVSLDCGRVWYDPATSEKKGGFYPDLASNVNVRYGSYLSDDGRFVASPVGENSENVRIASVANSREIANDCTWGDPLMWSDDSSLFACPTSAGLEIYDTETGASLGIANTEGASWIRAVFRQREVENPRGE